MTKKQTGEPELDDDGLIIQHYASTVLVVVPAEGYAETTLRYARSALYNVHVGTRVVAPQDDELIRGELQDEFQPDGRLAEARMDDYSGVILCGGPGAMALAEDAEAQRIAREAFAQDKLVAAWGHAPAVLARAGVVARRRLTGDPSLRQMLSNAGARYTGRQVEVDGKLVTALDDAAGFRFGKALVQIVRI